MKQKLLLIFTLVLFITFSGNIYANGLNLNGVGAKAVGMGGAFIAIADDYSAVFWNPAGLTQMDKASLSAFSSFIIPTGTYTYTPAGIDGLETENKVYVAPAFGYFKPVSDKLVLGLAAYATAGSGASWDGTPLVPFNTYYFGGLGDTTVYTWESMVGAFNISPVAAYKVSDAISLGLSLNIVYGLLDMQKEAGGQYTENLTGFGFGATIGAMFKPSDKFSIGFTFKTPMKVKLTGDVEMPGLAAIPGMPTISGATREITWPMWIGAGIAFKPFDKFTISFDVQYTDWKQLDEIPIEFDDANWVGAGLEEAAKFDLKWESKTQIRAGLEYQVSDSFAIRAGYYYDPAPSPETTLNIMLPSITYNVFTFGFGYHSEKMNIDFSFEYLSGTDRIVGDTAEEIAAIGAKEAMPGTHGMSMIVPQIALTYRF